ncbi:MAG: hypothetical protein KC613_16255, partial [Myxococcales bacterium]|nr:hypothetical protein [Myxococcales bacterium]
MRHLIPAVAALLALGCNAEFPEETDLGPSDAEVTSDQAPAGRDQRPPDQAVDAAVDQGPPPCEPVAELCDGLDNDCDGRVDEEFRIGQQCGEGLGPCRAQGLTECAPDGRGTVCNAQPLPGSEEQCDGVDNDCNGVVDDIAGLGEACTLRAELSPDCTAEGILRCEPEGRGAWCDGPAVDADGDFYGCEDDCDDSDPTVNRAATEICNLIDDDCDGQVDNGDQVCVCRPEDRGGRTYLFCPQARSWAAARDVCRGYRADLAVLDAPGEQAWVQNQIERIDDSRLIPWLIGLADLDGDRVYTWITGAEPSWDGWERFEPTPILNGQPAVAALAAAHWQALDPGNTRSFVCEPVCEFVDRDGDGANGCDADCDDTNANIGPAARELCDPEGIDEDCDGEVDE